MSEPRKSFTIDDVIAKATPVEKVVPVCVAGGLVGEYERLQLELENAPNATRLGGGPDAAIVKQLRELEGQIKDATYEFRFRALSAKAWSDLIAAHPDKAGKKVFNVDTFPSAAIAACCIEPAGMDDPAKVAALMENLSTAQQGDLFDGAWEVNTSAPKGRNFYTEFAARQDSVKNSGSAASEGSPEASSSAA